MIKGGKNLNYQIVAAVLAFVSILSIIIALILKRERKRNLHRNYVFKKTISNLGSVIEFFNRFLGPLMPQKGKMEEAKHYFDIMEINNITYEKIYIYSMGIGLVLGIIYFIILSFINIYLAISGVFIGIITGYNLPVIFLKSKYESIQMEKQLGILPYVEMLQVACEAGLTLTIAIERVYDYYPSSLSLEFKKANNDFMTNIKTRKESFEEIVNRVGGEEIRLLIETITQSLDTGTPIKTALKILSDTIRREMRKSIIIKGQKAKWKNFVISLCFQFPPYIFIIAGPSFVALIGSLN